MSDSVECPKCGKSFGSEESMVNHHSAMTDGSHSDSIREVDTNCGFCHSVVTYLPSQSKSEMKFCNASCRSQYFGEHQKKFNYDIHIHHKIPIRKFSNTEEANKMSNLITLCASCHMKIESEIIEVTAVAE